MTSVLATFAACAVIALSGCNDPAPEPGTEIRIDATEFDQLLSDSTGSDFNSIDALELSPGAQEIMERAVERGVVTFGDVDEAINLTLACFDDAGIRGDKQERVEFQGRLEVDFTFRVPEGAEDDSWLRVADDCMDRNSHWIHHLYSNQPQAEWTADQWFESERRAEAHECLSARGVEMPDGAIHDDYVSRAKALLDQTGDSTCLEIALS